MTRLTVQPHRTHVLFAAALACALCGLSPGSAHAQEEDGSQTLTTSTTTTSVVAMTAGPVMTTSAVVGDEEQETASRVERYLRANPAAVELALSMGAGSAVEDLAALLGVASSEVSVFARGLRAKRDVLRELADPEVLTPERARAFVRVVRGV